jgi:phosphoenolpyruvate carboxylase
MVQRISPDARTDIEGIRENLAGMDLSSTIHLLGDILGTVLSEQESPEIFEIEERIRLSAKARRSGDQEAEAGLVSEVKALTEDQARAVASAFALYFDLVNLAEENERVQTLRVEATSEIELALRGTVAEAVQTLSQSGVSREDMASLVADLSIELVLTAHPTEAKRRTILSKIQRIAEILRYLHEIETYPNELERAKNDLYEEITSFWLTDRTRTSHMEVTDEVRTGLYFIENYFWDVLPRIYHGLNQALRRFYPGLEVQHPWLRLASWIGGDRDGNPYVTTQVTAETMRLHRGLAVEHHRRELQDLARRLSLSGKRIDVPAELLAWLESRRPFPVHVAYLENRYVTEPFRLAVSLLSEDLAIASQDNMTARLLSDTSHTARAQVTGFTYPLKIIANSLPEALASGKLETIRYQFDIFGLSAARLDIRQDSAALRAALGEILRALHLEHEFEEEPAEKRVALLTRLLASSLPELSSQPGITRKTSETLALFQLIARTRKIYGPDLLGPVIISMTRDAGDILTALVLAKWMGADFCLSIVPLFETIADLESAPEIMDEVFRLPTYRKHLEDCCNEQMVMIGYSDSNKDGGYLAANWALYESQERIARVCKEHHIRLTLFHGRGGTIARGGGPASRAIRSQPAGTIQGRFRLTEQGEIISSRYSNPILAQRHLEQVVNAVLLRSAPHSSQEEVPDTWRHAIRRMSEASMQAYRKLVFETPEFVISGDMRLL